MKTIISLKCQFYDETVQVLWHSPLYLKSYVTPPTRVRYTHPPKPHSRPGHGTNVTPRQGSAPTHRAGREHGTLAREAGALTRNAKGYSL